MADFQAELTQMMAGLRRRETGSYQGNYTEVNGIGAAGAYQYMPGTWRSWAGPALARQYPTANLAPPQIQDEVARRNLTALYQQFGGNWNYVAQAWLAGPGGVGKHRSDGSTTTDAYASDVLRYAGLTGNGSPVDLSNRQQYMDSGRPAGDTPTATPSTATVDPNADRHDLGNQLQDFLDMLGTNTAPAGQTSPPPTTNPADIVQERMAS